MSTPEIQNRIVEYRTAYAKAKSEGASDHQANLYAMRQARDLMDFMRAGRTIRWLNAYIPFLNAQVQGLSRAWRGAKEDPSGFLRKWIIYSVAPTMLAYALNAMQGEEHEEEYLALPDYQRDMFYNIRVPGYGWVRIPKAFELGLASSAVERSFRAMKGDSKAWEGYARSASNVAGVDMGTFLGAMTPAVEVMTNRDTFRNKAIVPPYESDLELGLRKGTARASSIGRLFQGTTGMDARHIDHLINSYLGRVGRLTTDVGRLGNSDYQVGLMQWLYHATGLTTDIPGYNSPDVQWVLRTAKSVGARGALEDEVEAFFSAKSPGEKEEAARTLRQSARALRSEADALMQQTHPSERSDALKMLFQAF